MLCGIQDNVLIILKIYSGCEIFYKFYYLHMNWWKTTEDSFNTFNAHNTWWLVSMCLHMLTTANIRMLFTV
jgi:hypothetical protein